MSFVFFVVNPSYQIGVDGGGTKTEAILLDATGAIIARHNAGGCNPSQVGPAQARAVLENVLGALLAGSTISQLDAPVARTLLCLAGSRQFWTETAATLKTYGRVTVTDDALPVLELATGGAPGLVLHAGTGSFVAARAPDGQVHYAGGLGWKLGDPGSAFELGRRGIAHGLLELQGWMPASDLGPALQAHTRLTEAGAITRHFYAAPDANALIAGFAPRVTDLAAEGCAPAQIALTASLSELLDLGRAVTARLFPAATIPCGLSGALLNCPPARHALVALAKARDWRVEFRPIAEPPIEGVRRLLMAGR